jgi:hypothetical protein
MIDPAVIRASALRGDDRYPYAAWMPIPEAATQPHILPRLLILHSEAGPALTSLENLHRYVARDDVHIEPTFILDMDGRMAQLVDIFTRADCSAKANPFATSVETQDHGSATLATTAWTDQQIAQLAGLAAWMHLHPAIQLPLTPVIRWDGTGVGPHRQFPEWSVYVGKTCPGNTRVAQVPLVISRARSLVQASPSTPNPPVSEEDDDDMIPYFIATAPGRGSALLRVGENVTMVGCATAADAQAQAAAFKAEPLAMSDQQFDGFADQATWKRS